MDGFFSSEKDGSCSSRRGDGDRGMEVFEPHGNVT